MELTTRFGHYHSELESRESAQVIDEENDRIRSVI
jgi:hypothetical protein